MAYDRYDTRDAPRGERSRWSSDDRYSNPDRAWRSDDRGPGTQRGFFERAGDEIASWFGDDDAERRRRRDEMRDNRHGRASSDARDYDRGYGRDNDRDHYSENRSSNWNDNRGAFARGGSSDRDYDRNWRQEFSGQEYSQRVDQEPDRGWNDRYEPMTGNYSRSSREMSDQDRARSQSPYGRDEYRGTSRAGSANWSDRSRSDRADRDHDAGYDTHYQSWRDRHMSDLDRDYDDYRAENQSRFESDFGSWRERRLQKRGLLSMVSPHMEVMGSDKKHVGTVDKVAGDRLILTKSDPDSGGAHHSLSCSDIDRVDGDKVILECSADKARERWRDESRNRALFERDDQGEMGPRILDRSFEGTYR